MQQLCKDDRLNGYVFFFVKNVHTFLYFNYGTDKQKVRREREKIEAVPRVCQFYVSYLCKFRQKLKFISSDIQEIPLLIFSEVFSVVL